MTDLEIAKNTKPQDISEIAREIGIDDCDIELYGKHKAKCAVKKNLKAKLVLVTAINPTSAGEGKTTVSIGLADGIRKLGKSSCLALREPSLGPVFGIKGGAAGGGYSQVIPMQDINLHFTGDLHAITAANNLLCAMIDNHIFHGNSLEIDEDNIYFQRCTDTNDRALRDTTVAKSKKSDGRRESFVITAASEVMAILCLSTNLNDLKERLGNICIGINKQNKLIYARDLKAQGAMAALLKDAMKPNLVQTLEKTPAFLHGGPFANIAHGCNSVIATYAAMSCADYAVTEAGFGADLGAEKFLDCKCRIAGIEPSAVVIVATVRALKLHGGATDLVKEDLAALEKGIENLRKHIENIKEIYKKPVVVAINKFNTDTLAELNFITDFAASLGVNAAVCNAFSRGGDGAKELASEVIKACETKSKLNYAYHLDLPIKEKIEQIAIKVYGGDGATFSQTALEKIQTIENQGYKNLPVIIAKTQYSLSDDKNLLAMPKNFKINVRDIILKSGAGFVVAVCGSVNLMPGLSKTPAAQNIDVNGGEIYGLF